jgi:hypothetical protein
VVAPEHVGLELPSRHERGSRSGERSEDNSVDRGLLRAAAEHDVRTCRAANARCLPPPFPRRSYQETDVGALLTQILPHMSTARMHIARRRPGLRNVIGMRRRAVTLLPKGPARLGRTPASIVTCAPGQCPAWPAGVPAWVTCRTRRDLPRRGTLGTWRHPHRSPAPRPRWTPEPLRDQAGRRWRTGEHRGEGPARWRRRACCRG